jgi:hypothetical protein
MPASSGYLLKSHKFSAGARRGQDSPLHAEFAAFWPRRIVSLAAFPLQSRRFSASGSSDGWGLEAEYPREGKSDIHGTARVQGTMNQRPSHENADGWRHLLRPTTTRAGCDLDHARSHHYDESAALEICVLQNSHLWVRRSLFLKPFLVLKRGDSVFPGSKAR